MKEGFEFCCKISPAITPFHSQNIWLLKRFKGLKVYLLHLTPAGVFEYNSTKMIYTCIHEILKLGIINITTNNLSTNINTKIHSMLKCLGTKISNFIHF